MDEATAIGASRPDDQSNQRYDALPPDRARDDRRLAWLIVGGSGVVTLVLLVLAASWAKGQLARWAADQQREFRAVERGRGEDTPYPVLSEASVDADTPLPVAQGPVPPSNAHPVGDAASWIGSDDYPPSALRNRWEGRVRVTVAVDRAGSPTGCAVRQTSGHWSLDNATCAAMLNNGRFDAASRGPRVRYWTSPVVRWQLPT